MKTITNITLFAVVSFILLPLFCNIWGIPTENGTNSGNNSKRNGLIFSNIDNLTGVLSTTYPEVSMKGLVVTSPDSTSKSFPLVIDIFPDKNDYTYFEDIQIYYKVDGNKLEPVKLIFEDRDPMNKIVYRASKSLDLTNTNNSKPSFDFHPGKIGMHNASITAIQGTNYERASTTYNVIEFTHTNLFYFILIGLFFFFGLLFFIAYGLKNSVIDEILRFLFLSGLVTSFLAILLFTDIQFGTQAPIGLMIVTGNDMAKNWVFNIGGAIQIPVYVAVFGLIGGYIRYLYKTSRIISTEPSKRRNNQVLENKYESKKNRRLIFLQSLRDIALFLLSPLLAIVVYFLLFKIGMDGSGATYTIAVACFGVGLVTEDVIRKLIGFTNQQLTDNDIQYGDDSKDEKIDTTKNSK